MKEDEGEEDTAVAKGAKEGVAVDIAVVKGVAMKADVEVEDIAVAKEVEMMVGEEDIAVAKVVEEDEAGEEAAVEMVAEMEMWRRSLKACDV